MSEELEVRNEELKPCPFCGGEAEVYKHTTKFVDVDDPVEVWRVHCKKLDCAMLLNYFDSQQEAIEVWNRRV